MRFYPIQDGLFQGSSRMMGGEGGGGGAKRLSLLKICPTYLTMMKLCSYTLPKNDPKII